MEKQIETKIKGHKVEVWMRQDGREELWIDSHRRNFFITEDGYNLNDDCCSPPQKTLINAAEHYLHHISN